MSATLFLIFLWGLWLSILFGPFSPILALKASETKIQGTVQVTQTHKDFQLSSDTQLFFEDRNVCDLRGSDEGKGAELCYYIS